MVETAHDDPPGLPAALEMSRFGPKLGWLLFSLGIVWGASRSIGRIADGPTSAAGFATAILDALAISLAFGLSGWVASMALRLVSTLIEGRIERARLSGEARLALATRAVAALERLVEALETRPTAEVRVASPGPDRAGLLAEIDEVLRSGRGEEAESLLDGFIAAFPDDPAIADRKQRIVAARREAVEGDLERIHAARQVNDAGRVLELFRGLGPSLESGRRGELERELSRWFLGLIHRRLRGGRIQADVVELAAMVAETFPATTEGASLRASLPTLRRSVGLCPRCAQPYVGTAAACPQCLAGSSGDTAPATVEPDLVDDSDPEGPTHPPRETSSRDPNDGWTFYDEDDRDDRDSPA